MYKIAKDAFANHDYHLAGELFERCIEDTRIVHQLQRNHLQQNLQLECLDNVEPEEKIKLLDLYFLYGDSLARSGRIYEAFDTYAFIANQLSDVIALERWKHLCVGLLESITNASSYVTQTMGKLSSSSASVSSSIGQQIRPITRFNRSDSIRIIDPLLCPICEDILRSPVTGSCGHTFCRQCCITATQCPICNISFPITTQNLLSNSATERSQQIIEVNNMDYDIVCDKTSEYSDYNSDLNNICCNSINSDVATLGLKSDILVRRLVDKWWPGDLHARQLNDEAVKYLDINSLDDALKCCNESLEKSPNNHKSLLLRSEVLYRLNHYQSSLADADNALKTRPASGKAYHRRALALAGLGRTEEALIALCLAACLDRHLSYTTSTSFKQEICRLLQTLFMTTRHRCSTAATSSPYGDVAKRKKKRRKQYHLTQKFGTSDCDEANSSCGEEDLHPSHHLHMHHYHHNLRQNHHKPYIRSTRAYTKRTACMTIDTSIPTPNARLRNLLDRIQQEAQKLRRVQLKPTLLQLRPAQIDVTDFDCVLCCRTLWRPVVTPCGHTYCWICLDRSMDYSSLCPLCKSPLVEQYKTSYRGSTTPIPFSLGKKSVTKFLETAMERFIPECYEKRHRQEIELEPSVPLFICTTAFPQVPCPLFVYEPRYRLMVRRSVESGERQFGIVQPHTGKSRYSDIGTMLEIRDCVLLGDGCSILSTVGCRRFRIISHDEKDGYETAKVEYIYDEPIPEHRLSEVERMHNLAFNKAVRWFQSLTNEFKEEILRSFGPMPNIEVDWTTVDDGPAWAWWIIAILPLNQQLKVDILATTSLEKRLRAIEKTLDYISSKIQKSQQSCVVVPCEGLPTCQAIECCQQRATSSSTNDEQQTRNDPTEYML